MAEDLYSGHLPTREELSSLADRARSALASLPDNSEPVVVEFAGSPKSGKSTNIDIVAHFFKRCGYKVWAPSEGASKRTPYHLKRDWIAFNTWTLAYAIQELMVSYHNVDQQHLIILDRGPYDAVAWMNHLSSIGKLEAEEVEIIEKFAMHPRWIKFISRVYIFKSAPAVSLEREHASKLITEKQGSAMNAETLGALLAQYDSLESQLRSESHPVRVFDTTESPGPLATSYSVATDIVQMFKNRTERSG
jgi:predicted ATPase